MATVEATTKRMVIMKTLNEIVQSITSPSILDQTPQQLVFVVGIPAHKVNDLCKKQLTSNGSRFSLSFGGTAPGKGIPCTFSARAQCQNLGVPIDHNLDILGHGEFRQTRRIYRKLAIINSW